MRNGEISRWRPLVKRIILSLLSIILVIILIASVNFAIFRTGDESRLVSKMWPPVLQEVLREELRLDEHIVIQYFDYLASTFTGDFYTSTGVRPLSDVELLVYHAFLRTVFLLVIVSTVSILLGMAWGRFMGKNAGKAYGKVLHVLAVSSLSFPMFYLACSLLVIVSDFDLGFPVRSSGFDEGVLGALRYAVLPTLSLIVAGSGFFALVTRAGLLRAEHPVEKTTSFAALDRVNPFPYFLFPLVMIGIFSVDAVYDYGGLGSLTRDAMMRFDVPVLMACFFVISAIVFFSQLAFRAVRERNRFMHHIDGILGPSVGAETQNALDLRRKPRERLSIPLLVSGLREFAGAYSRQKSGVAAAIVLAIILFLGLFAPPLNLYDVTSDILAPPGSQHLLGTDSIGRDLFSMNLHAAGVGIAEVFWTSAVSVLCGLFVGSLSIVLCHYSGFLSRFGRRSMAVVSLSFLAISWPLIPICIAASPYSRQLHLIDFLLILFVYCWAYRTITWPLSNSLRSVAGARRWNETGKVLRDSLGLFRCRFSLVLSRTLHVTKYLVVLIVIFYVPSWRFASLGPMLDSASVDWNYLLDVAYQNHAFALGYWWMFIPPLVGIVALAVSSYFFVEALERVFDERAESLMTTDGPGKEALATDTREATERVAQESRASIPATGPSE